MDKDFDLESLIHVEQTFYDSGFQDGFEHGRIHGLIEGRALGREKGFEMWEELGYYEGFALTWRAIHEKQSRQDHRSIPHIRNLLELISQFPTVNPSATDAASDVDISKLLRQIRSKYKILCSNLGVRPRLTASRQTPSQDHEEEDMGPDDIPEQKSQLPVWKIEKGNGLNASNWKKSQLLMLGVCPSARIVSPESKSSQPVE
ncbi:uncharacterized protein LACBIDRAFT_243559 [Laccaria bicolor S238N-H82]|uniref:Predicted protein n=1 Tax=Laccaria bicolor (strain S238N-H82 / ATCC MYA-4686) TaxID=486041 RepID=B0CNP7_LACBS|nr:uncharacterized protein LACBIDRAFT_243559 [Laccaria bicolor S238N-H82]EDR15972.1 predicted protein [Laccaria bicolor S238N-H82]|eukprot:XP_001874180.1 predicted protein [Laccaria bicolor S238N-H82]